MLSPRRLRIVAGVNRYTAAAVYRLTPATILNLRGESIRYEGNVAIAIPGIRIPTSATATSATASPAFGAYAFGYVPEEIVPWDFNPFGRRD